MYSSVKRLGRILVSISLIFIMLNICWPTWAQSAEPNSQKNRTVTATKHKTTNDSLSDVSANEIPEEPKKVDKVGQKVGQQIDDITQQASSRIGSWINAKVFAGITWFKLILCLFLLFFVLLIERLVRLTIDRKRRKAEEEKEVKKIRFLILEAVAKPLSMFIWIYGIYMVLTPLFVHFQKPDGTNLVHTVAQKTADLGAAVALVWFIFKLVSVLDFHLKRIQLLIFLAR